MSQTMITPQFGSVAYEPGTMRIRGTGKTAADALSSVNTQIELLTAPMTRAMAQRCLTSNLLGYCDMEITVSGTARMNENSTMRHEVSLLTQALNGALTAASLFGYCATRGEHPSVVMVKRLHGDEPSIGVKVILDTAHGAWFQMVDQGRNDVAGEGRRADLFEVVMDIAARIRKKLAT